LTKSEGTKIEARLEYYNRHHSRGSQHLLLASIARPGFCGSSSKTSGTPCTP
jgi:hypothetical protein